MHAYDTLLAHHVTLHLLHGYSQPGYAMLWADALLRDLDRQPPAFRQGRLHFAAGLLRQALMLHPFDDALRGLVNTLSRMAPPSPEYAAWLRGVEACFGDHANVPSNEALGRAYDLPPSPDAVLEAVRAAVGSASHGDAFACLLRLWELGSWEHMAAGVTAFMATPVASLVAPLFAHAALAAGDDACAASCVAVSLPSPLLTLYHARRAHAAGDRDGARDLYAQALAGEPAQLHLLRTLDDLDRPAPPADILAGKRIGIGFYTWNKFEVTLDTLRSLLASDTGGATIAVINNGSTTFSREDFETAVRATAAGRPVELIHLPVNVGAPAARNWLWHLDSMREADLFAFLDDDVLLPQDWLRCYVQDMEEHPGTVVVGPKGVNPGTLPTVQYVARFFEKTGRHLIRFTNNAPLVMDFGQYDHARPCLSVMGCCHLLDRHACQRLGVPDFDIRFSPSQVDDLEHDIQVWKAGGMVRYDGRVRVVHRQDAGRAAPLSEAAWGHVWGNHHKMERKFTEEELASIDRATRRADARDLLATYGRTAPRLPAAARMLAGLCVRTLQAASE